MFALLGCAAHTALVDFRVFLPEAWAQDAAGFAKAKVPEAQLVHRSICELALDCRRRASARLFPSVG